MEKNIVAIYKATIYKDDNSEMLFIHCSVHREIAYCKSIPPTFNE